MGVSESELAVGRTEVWREKAEGQACVWVGHTHRDRHHNISLFLPLWALSLSISLEKRVQRERERERERASECALAALLHCMDACRFLWSKKLETAAQLPDNTPPSPSPFSLFLFPYSSRVPATPRSPSYQTLVPIIQRCVGLEDDYGQVKQKSYGVNIVMSKDFWLAVSGTKLQLSFSY